MSFQIDTLCYSPVSQINQRPPCRTGQGWFEQSQRSVNTATSDNPNVQKNPKVDLWQIAPLLLAAALLTIGLAMFLSGTRDLVELVRPLIVVFGGTVAALLLTFPPAQLANSLQLALDRGIRGGVNPADMLGAMLKVCEVSRRDGLLGVAELRSGNASVEDVCALIGDAAEKETIDKAFTMHIEAAIRRQKISHDVFLFAALYAAATGLLGSLIHLVGSVAGDAVGGEGFLPLICGLCLALLLTMLIGRMRAAHHRELLAAEIAYRGAALILEDNNVHRLRGRLAAVLDSASD